ncbi:hypothetical protein [Nocardia transvalensis]|uniref:hypothetical protein n=1 Tax=Nocardia transvalensis TaxID=37333 RepID=UPI001893CBCE|nr:hypothetical protein [Nocardia transvalensis]MBF6332381.1 hypothetical protein [Nocardia transvalensis]
MPTFREINTGQVVTVDEDPSYFTVLARWQRVDNPTQPSAAPNTPPAAPPPTPAIPAAPSREPAKPATGTKPSPPK